MSYLKKKKIKTQHGYMIILAIVFTFLFISIMGSMLSLFVYQNRLAQKIQAKEAAIQIAEAGINYYRWHLAHAEEDYADGTADVCVYPNPCGPYTHDYKDPLTDEKIGEFELYITPPPIGSTIVTIKSTGWLDDFTGQYRIVEVKYGIPSLATYSFLTNTDIWFGDTEGVVGPLHSNGGIRMDGTNDSTVTSYMTTYTCMPYHGCSPAATKPGVWGAGAGSSLWQSSAPYVNFATISLDLGQMQLDSQTQSGVHYPCSNFDPETQLCSGSAKGYRVIFNNDGTFDVYRVNTLKATVKQYNDSWSAWALIAEEPADLPAGQTLVDDNKAAPANGIIFMEDNVWVEGEVNGRFTLVSAKLTGIPADYTTIRINNNINYVARDGTNVLGLIAEKDVRIPRYAPSVLTVDAIILAQNGRAFYNNYYNNLLKTSIEIYGGVITNNIWTWSWCSGNPCINNDGYNLTISIYDNNMLYAPPPSFPSTPGAEYTFISWKEKKP